MAYSGAMRRAVPWWLPVGLLVIIGIAGWMTYKDLTKNIATGNGITQNYQISYTALPNWKWCEPNPASLFTYQNPKTRAVLRGGTTQILSDYNPTPELDSDGIAEYYIDTTKRHQSGWTVQRLPDIETSSERFTVLDRRKEGKRVLTCFCVKGNTTLVVALSGYGKGKSILEEHIADLKRFLASVRLTPTVFHYPSDEEVAANSGQ